ncbi:MAG: hypothetical protein KGL03_06260 [Nitrospirota bacterium]|nr:hypothetical protein [Nitrospirota bacterium]
MAAQHASLAAGRWQTLSLVEQLANVGSEVARVRRWQGKDTALCVRASVRAFELLALTIGDPRWRRRLKELTRVRECLCDAMTGGQEYGNTLESLDRYFLAFAVAARIGRANVSQSTGGEANRESH